MKLRIPAPLKAKLAALAELHGAFENEIVTEALDAFTRTHDEATCENYWCEARRKKGGKRDGKGGS